MDARDIYVDTLKESLVINGGLNSRQVHVALSQFETLAAKHGNEEAFKKVLGEFGNESVASALSRIREALEQANLRRMDVNPVTRLRSYINRVNQGIEKMEVELPWVNESQLSDHQKAELEIARSQRKNFKLKMPNFVRMVEREKNFCALAQVQGKAVKLDMDIRF